MQRHFCVHTGRKPYPCDYIDPETLIPCPLEFNYPGRLKTHKATHNREYFCGFPNCSKSFATIVELKLHKDENHAEDKFNCPICGMEVKHLKEHLSTHNVNRTIYNCEFPGCSKSFTRVCLFICCFFFFN